jgi:hypothetical protein
MLQWAGEPDEVINVARHRIKGGVRTESELESSAVLIKDITSRPASKVRHGAEMVATINEFTVQVPVVDVHVHGLVCRDHIKDPHQCTGAEAHEEFTDSAQR